MNSAHWHLLLNHLPVVGTFFSTILLAAGLIMKNSVLKNAGLSFFILTGLCAIPVLLTGEGAEEILESIGQDNHDFIHHHEDISKNAFWVSMSVAILSLGALIGFLKQKKHNRILMIAILIAGLANSVLMVKAANSGGEIRHTEIR